MAIAEQVEESEAVRRPARRSTEVGWQRSVRTAVPVMAGLIAVVALLFSGYSSGFGNPKPHNIPIAVVGPPSVQSSLNASPALQVHPTATAASAREAVLDRHVYGALDFDVPGHTTLLVANGAGHSVDTALTTIGAQTATSSGTTLQVQDLAPTSPQDPNGTVEFYAIVFLAIGAALGATVLGRVLGAVRDLAHLPRRLFTLAVFSFLLAITVSFFADVGFGALVGHFAPLVLTLWAYTFAVCLAASGVGALFGQAAGLALTLTFTVIGNTSAGGPVGRPLTNAFLSAMNPIFPHGAGMTIVRSVQYFGGRGIADSVLGLSAWTAAGLALLVASAFRQGREHAGRHEQSAHDHSDPSPATAESPRPILA